MVRDMAFQLALPVVLILLHCTCTEAARPLNETRIVSTNGTALVGGSEEENLPPVLERNSTLQDDISATGNCSVAIAFFCKGVQAGESNLAECLTAAVRAERAAVEDTGHTISDNCKEELRQFKMARSRNIKLDKKLAKACRKDIAEFCNDQILMPGPEDVITCLRENKDQVKKRCKKQILRLQLDAADDFKLDPLLYDACKSEADKLCPDVEPGEGRVQSCLRQHRRKVKWECQAELFRQEIENADDIRLDFQLILLCKEDKNKFCADVEPGDARVKDCLEDHRLDPDFSPACKAQFDNMMMERASDFRLDTNLEKFCKQDINRLCYPEELHSTASADARVIECLQDYRKELKDPRCKAQVHKLTSRAAEDIRFDKPLAEACYDDRQKVCKEVPDGGGQVFRCLQDNRNKLTENCRAAVFEEEVRFAEDIDFKYPMKQACIGEIERYCKGVPDGHAAIIGCLQEHVEDVDMSEACRKEVQHDAVRSAEDYRLNYRLTKACSLDISAVCAKARNACDASNGKDCAGTVLQCLQDNVELVKSAACRQEISRFQQAEARDIRLDVPFQAACSGDLAKLCADKRPDHGEQLSCLRVHREELSEPCKQEELKFSIMEASDLRLIPSLMNACATELQVFCRSVSPLEGAAFRCLQANLGQVEFGTPCKAEVNVQEARHTEDYRLDIRLRRECQADVDKACKDVGKGREGHGLVLKCLVDQFPVLSGECQTEVSYAVRMALWQYREAADFTAACDESVRRYCKGPEAKSIGGTVIGVYGQCLADVFTQGKELSPECHGLVLLATHSTSALVGESAAQLSHGGATFDVAKLGDELAEKVAKKEDERRSREPKVESQALPGWTPKGLVLTGWVAFVSIAALVLVLVAVAFAVYRKYSPTRPYTLVTKAGDI